MMLQQMHVWHTEVCSVIHVKRVCKDTMISVIKLLTRVFSILHSQQTAQKRLYLKLRIVLSE
jgi:hypothetical protein